MLGAIVGDVIGSPFEHCNVKSTAFRLFDRGAQCTDDSILTVATADVLLNPGDYAKTYQEYYSRFPNAGRLAVSVGGDSDTIASIAGAIAHAFYGGIPRHLLEPVMEIYLSPDLVEITMAFCQRFGVPSSL